MNASQAKAAARSFISAVTKPDQQWTLNDIDRHMPAGWELEEYADQAEFLPLTVANVASAILRNAIRG